MLIQNLIKPQEITLFSSLLRNLVFIISALVAFSLWLSSTISTPKRLDKLEEQIILINTKQNILENKTTLIYSKIFCLVFIKIICSSSTISTPKRLDKLEEQIILINTKQNILENKTTLIYSEVKETKTLLLEKLKK